MAGKEKRSERESGRENRVRSLKCAEKGRTSLTEGHASNREVCFLTEIRLRRLSWKTD